METFDPERSVEHYLALTSGPAWGGALDDLYDHQIDEFVQVHRFDFPGAVPMESLLERIAPLSSCAPEVVEAARRLGIVTANVLFIELMLEPGPLGRVMAIRTDREGEGYRVAFLGEFQYGGAGAAESSIRRGARWCAVTEARMGLEVAALERRNGNPLLHRGEADDPDDPREQRSVRASGFPAGLAPSPTLRPLG